MRHFWMSSERMTVRVTVDANFVITECAPVVNKFKGQKLQNLERWMRAQGGFRWQELT